MSTMRFMSCPSMPGLLKIFSFDSSPGRAIGQALDAGIWDEGSYRSVLMEERPGEKIYEVFMTKKPTDEAPEPREQKVGMITHRPTI